MILPTVQLLTALLSFGSPSSPELRASFSADVAAWAATDVVVVTEGEAVDGRVTVIESWLGDTEPGTEMALDTLAHYGSDENREVQQFHFETQASKREPVEQVTGNRMVLFLNRNVDGTLRLTDTAEEAARSVAWLEADLAYARIQFLNPGDNDIYWTGATVTELQGQVERMDALRDALDTMEAIPNPLVRVMAVAPHCHDPRRFVQERAFKIVEASGPSGADYLRSLALDTHLPNLKLAPRALRSLSQDPSQDQAATLNKVLATELEYWTRVELPESWWNAVEPDRAAREYRHARYARLTAALRTLDGLSEEATSPALATVTALETLWGTRPELLELSDSSVLNLSRHILAKDG